MLNKDLYFKFTQITNFEYLEDDEFIHWELTLQNNKFIKYNNTPKSTL